MRKFLLLLMFLGLCILPVSAVTVTVGYSGNTGNYNVDGTNDHVEINQALTYIGNLGGGTVYLKGPRTYTISDPLILRANTVLTGDSTAEIRLVNSVGWPASESYTLLRIIGNGVTVKGFTIDGNSGNNSVSLGSGYNSLIYSDGPDNIRIENMRLEYSSNDGYHCERGNNITFINNDVYYMGHDAAYFMYGCTNVEVAYNTMVLRTNSACRISGGGRYVKIHDNIINGGLTTGPAIEIDSTSTSNYLFNDIEIYNNKIYSNQGSGIWMFTNYQDNTIRAQGVHIHHNTFTRTGYYKINGYSNAGITIQNFNGTIIEHNVFDDSGVAAVKWGTPTYRLQNTAFKTIVRNNIILNHDVTDGLAYTGWGVTQSASNNQFILQNNIFHNNERGNAYGTAGVQYVQSGSINANPLFADGAATYANRDYHLRSTAGRWTGTTWVADSVTSPGIDAGHVDSAYQYEPWPHGYRVNIGRYGNTIHASKSGSIFTPPEPDVEYTGKGIYSWVYSQTVANITNGQTIATMNDIKKVYVTIDSEQLSYSSSSMPMSGLVGWWPLATDALDDSGQDNHGTANSITYSGGRANFDGVNSYITIGKPAELDFTGKHPFTLLMRYKYTGTKHGTLVSSGAGLMGHGNYGWATSVNNANGNLYFDVYSSTKRSAAYIPYASEGHLAVVWDGSGNQKIYQDGILTRNFASIVTSIGTTQDIKIGVDTPENLDRFKGQIWDVAIYETALDASTIQSIYNGATVSGNVQLKVVGGTYEDYTPSPHILTSGSAITGVTFSTGTLTLDNVTVLETGNATLPDIVEEDVNATATKFTITHVAGNTTTSGTITYFVNSKKWQEADYYTFACSNPAASATFNDSTLIINTGPETSGVTYEYVVTVDYRDPDNRGEDILNPIFALATIAVGEGFFAVNAWMDKRRRRY